MIVRMWRTAIDPNRRDEYADFEQEHSLPMFRQQAGFLGVLFLRTDEGAAALSFWESRQHVEHLSVSASYRATVERLESTGLLRGEQTLEVFEAEGVHLDFVL